MLNALEISGVTMYDLPCSSIYMNSKPARNQVHREYLRSKYILLVVDQFIIFLVLED